MTDIIRGREKRRLAILDGINGGFANSKIAAKLGVQLWVVMSDLKRMRHNRDPELRQAIRKAREDAQAKKQSVASLPDERFNRMTGTTFKEKSFSNMMSFYKPELRKILRSEDECAAIRDLPNSVRKSLKRNGIIGNSLGTLEITAFARTCLTPASSVDS
jgi:type IV secretory pathway TrbD component